MATLLSYTWYGPHGTKSLPSLRMYEYFVTTFRKRITWNWVAYKKLHSLFEFEEEISNKRRQWLVLSMTRFVKNISHLLFSELCIKAPISTIWLSHVVSNNGNLITFTTQDKTKSGCLEGVNVKDQNFLQHTWIMSDMKHGWVT